MSPRTKKNLRTAMEAEAFSYATCARFAAHARIIDNHDLAKLFQVTADRHRCDHFEKQLEMADLIGSDPDNLEFVMDDQSAKVDLYSRFEQESASDGDLDAAALFGRIREDEVEQLESFAAAAERLKGLERRTRSRRMNEPHGA